jgi:hypothetical protein
MFWENKVCEKEVVDTGMAATLVLLIFGIITEDISFMMYSAVALFLNMTFSSVYTYVAIFWLSLSHYLGLMMSNVILSLIYFVIIIPIALFRSLLGHDPMRLREWKLGKDSLFIERNFSYGEDDLKHPY